MTLIVFHSLLEANFTENDFDKRVTSDYKWLGVNLPLKVQFAKFALIYYLLIYYLAKKQYTDQYTLIHCQKYCTDNESVNQQGNQNNWFSYP